MGGGGVCTFLFFGEEIEEVTCAAMRGFLFDRLKEGSGCWRFMEAVGGRWGEFHVDVEGAENEMARAWAGGYFLLGVVFLTRALNPFRFSAGSLDENGSLKIWLGWSTSSLAFSTPSDTVYDVTTSVGNDTTRAAGPTLRRVTLAVELASQSATR